jgi:iron-sulfur cluster assembly protein
MIITEKALSKLKERCVSAGSWGARLSVKGGGCGGYKYDLNYEDNPNNSNDILYQNILAVDIHSHEILANAVVDWEVKGINEEISVTNGMETSRCGCGESFTI